ncbi:hypothetical protein BDV06DRAFT_218671 [Aspergillus oleicola]
MVFKLALLLVACLLVVTGWADDNAGNLDDALTGADLEGHLSIEDWFKLYEDVDVAGTKIYRRAATVTVTETVCGPVASDGPSNPTGESAPFVSIPETTLVTATVTEPAPVPTTEAPVVSGTGSAPSDAEPTSVESTGVEPTLDGPSSDGPTTTHLHTHTSSPASGETTSADEPEPPTETSDGPSASAEPTLNAGFRQGGTSSLALAFALTFVRLFGV